MTHELDLGDDGDGRGAILWGAGCTLSYALAGLLWWGCCQTTEDPPEERSSLLSDPVSPGGQGAYERWLPEQ